MKIIEQAFPLIFVIFDISFTKPTQKGKFMKEKNFIKQPRNEQETQNFPCKLSADLKNSFNNLCCFDSHCSTNLTIEFKNTLII